MCVVAFCSLHNLPECTLTNLTHQPIFLTVKKNKMTHFMPTTRPRGLHRGHFTSSKWSTDRVLLQYNSFFYKIWQEHKINKQKMCVRQNKSSLFLGLAYFYIDNGVWGAAASPDTSWGDNLQLAVHPQTQTYADFTPSVSNTKCGFSLWVWWSDSHREREHCPLEAPQIRMHSGPITSRESQTIFK